MRNLALMIWFPICVLAMSGCAVFGKDARTPRPECQQPQPPPQSLMRSPNYEQQLRHELFESEPSATPRSAGYRQH